MITLDNFSRFNYYEISAISDANLRDYLITLYQLEMEALCYDNPHMIDFSLSIEQMNEKLFEEELKNTSSLLFPGDYIKFYPIIGTPLAKKNYICLYSGGIINSGTRYLTFKALLDNKTTKEKYITQNLNFELCTDISLPENILQFEYLYHLIDNAYNSSREEYYNFFTNNGGNIRYRKLNK